MSGSSGQQHLFDPTSRFSSEPWQRLIHEPVSNWNVLVEKGGNALHAGNIDTVLKGIASTPMVRMNPTAAAEIVLSDVRTPLVKGENLGTACHRQVLNWDAGHDIALATAQ